MTSQESIAVHTLYGNNGMQVDITNLGGRIIRLMIPDKDNHLRDVVLGFNRAEDYLPDNNPSDFGAIIGRYANRLAKGRISVDGVTYQLPQNNGPNCLHGGPMGWQYAIFHVEEATSNRIVLTLTSPDGDNGFPGCVQVRVVYSLENNSLRVDYHAVSDRTTVINMTNHSYFNLGQTSDEPLCHDILDHMLRIDADRYTPVDETSIPLGDHMPVEGTPFDFRAAKAIGDDINSDNEQLHIGRGYDHNYVLNHPSLDAPSVTLSCAATGISMDIYTDAPGVQLYTGNFLNGVCGKQGTRYPVHSAVCLETQQYPDSPNRHWLESTGYLHASEPYHTSTIYKFTTL